MKNEYEKKVRLSESEWIRNHRCCRSALLHNQVLAKLACTIFSENIQTCLFVVKAELGIGNKGSTRALIGR